LIRTKFCTFDSMTTIQEFKDHFNKNMVDRIVEMYEDQTKIEAVKFNVDETTKIVTISNCDYMLYEELSVFIGARGYPCQYQSIV